MPAKPHLKNSIPEKIERNWSILRTKVASISITDKSDLALTAIINSISVSSHCKGNGIVTAGWPAITFSANLVGHPGDFGLCGRPLILIDETATEIHFT
jgi:hypothetical protein